MYFNFLKIVIKNPKKYSKFFNNCSKNRSASNTRYFTSISSLIARKSDHQHQQNKKCYYCQNKGAPNNNNEANKLPTLMDFPFVVWPSVFKSLKNLIIANFIIKPYFDNDFSLPEFVTGSKKAVEVISNKLAKSEDLKGLLTEDVIDVLKNRIMELSHTQREFIPVNVDDIYLAFPYQIGVMFSNNEESAVPQKRFVEITMVYHVLNGLAAMRARNEEPPINLGMLPEFQEKISICNYRFVKEFTKGVQDDWTVNLLNHYRPKDEADSQ